MMTKFELMFYNHDTSATQVEVITGEYGNVLAYIQGYLSSGACSLSGIKVLEVLE